MGSVIDEWGNRHLDTPARHATTVSETYTYSGRYVWTCICGKHSDHEFRTEIAAIWDAAGHEMKG